MKKARVIYNPSSGKEEGKKRLPEILETLEGMGYESSAFATKGKWDARDEAKRCSEKRFDLIVVVGGDGTVYEVVNGLAEQEYRPKIAIVPLGTTNDFASAIGMTGSFKDMMNILKKGDTLATDVGKMNEKYFINVAGGGSLTELSYEVPSKMKTVFGQWAYYFKGVEKVAKFRPYSAEITIENETIHEEIMLFMVSNTNSVAGFDKFAPVADYGDGYFDVLVLKKCNIAELGLIGSKLIMGDHLNEDRVMHFRTNSLKIKTNRELKINLDGEFGGYAPCEFSVLPKHIEVIIDMKTKNR